MIGPVFLMLSIFRKQVSTTYYPLNESSLILVEAVMATTSPNEKVWTCASVAFAKSTSKCSFTEGCLED